MVRDTQMVRRSGKARPVLAEHAVAALIVVAVCFVSLSLYAIFVSGPAARELAEQQMAEELAAENRMFCENFGMPAGTREHELCTEALMAIRARQDKRQADGMQSIL
jgi:hypothetical protein